MMKTTIMTAITPLALVGCTTVGAPAATTMKFFCDRSDPISVSFFDDKAILNFAGGSATLDQKPSGSGFRYAGQSHEIRGKGMDLIWTKPDGATRSCREEKREILKPQTQERMPTLAASKWRLVHFQSSDDSIGTKVPPSLEKYNIEFMADGNLVLQLDCNRAGSTWEAMASSSAGDLSN